LGLERPSAKVVHDVNTDDREKGYRHMMDYVKNEVDAGGVLEEDREVAETHPVLDPDEEIRMSGLTLAAGELGGVPNSSFVPI
jgi:hypothetical protein